MSASQKKCNYIHPQKDAISSVLVAKEGFGDMAVR